MNVSSGNRQYLRIGGNYDDAAVPALDFGMFVCINQLES